MSTLFSVASFIAASFKLIGKVYSVWIVSLQEVDCCFSLPRVANENGCVWTDKPHDESHNFACSIFTVVSYVKSGGYNMDMNLNLPWNLTAFFFPFSMSLIENDVLEVTKARAQPLIIVDS